MNRGSGRRGRPRSTEKQRREQAQHEKTEDIISQCPGIYTDMWKVIKTGGRGGFEQFCEKWCKSQELFDGTTLYNLTGNCVFYIVEGVSSCKKESWYTCTRKQFMFQIADVCIVLHVILSLIKEVNCGAMDKQTLKQHVVSAEAFVLWAGNASNCDYGDILSAGDHSVLNFRRILQDGVIFHCMQRMQPCRADKQKQDQLIDLHCFRRASKWQPKHPVSIFLRNDGSAEIKSNQGVWYSLDAPSALQGDAESRALQQTHLATCTVDAFSRGKVLRHIVGRMKTLVGHNNTIPSSLVWLLNPTLTKDNSKRKRGNGPVLWSKLERRSDKHMKEKKKTGKISALPSYQRYSTKRFKQFGVENV